MKRTEIYGKFKKYAQQKDSRSMDQICDIGTDFKLQAQQDFLREYIQAYPQWKKLLLYHAIGSGKTCTSITMAETYMKMNPMGKVKVILPARLLTNFIDELLSPCGVGVYISREELTSLQSSQTSENDKKKIRIKCMKKISKNYTLFSFEKLKRIFKEHKNNTKAWVKEFTTNSLIIVDEVHNMLSEVYDEIQADILLKQGLMEETIKGLNTVLLKMLVKHGDASCKFLFLTATPIFNSIRQLRELVTIMTDSEVQNDMNMAGMIHLLRGKVSYFPGTSINAYPKVEYNDIKVLLSKTQDELIHQIIKSGIESETNKDHNMLKEAFMVRQRQISLACLPKFANVGRNPSKVISNLPEYAPKIKHLFDSLNKPGKHVVFSNFIQSGLNIIAKVLERAGWRNFLSLNGEEEKYKFKTFVVWDGSTKDINKQIIKNALNHNSNLEGEKIRVVLGSPSIKEGVSFKHIQHVHIMDPVWNQSGKDQVEGRSIRYCSHVEIPHDHPTLKRKVIVHLYKSTPYPAGNVTETSDEIMYRLIKKKDDKVKNGESALKKVAIDHFLFRNMYLPSRKRSPPPSSRSVEFSDLELSPPERISTKIDRNNYKKPCKGHIQPDKDGRCPPGYEHKRNESGEDCCYKIRKVIVKTTCPKSRKPNKDGECPPNHEIKKNKHDDLCCYKIRNAKTTCPKSRKPNKDGECPPNYENKKNKHGDDCCYKTHVKN